MNNIDVKILIGELCGHKHIYVLQENCVCYAVINYELTPLVVTSLRPLNSLELKMFVQCFYNYTSN